MATPREIARAATAYIIDDLNKRKGLRHAWDEIDGDIVEEIKAKWETLIIDAIMQPDGRP